MLRPVRVEDAPALCAVYNPYVERTVITFEEAPVSAGAMARRIQSVTARHPWLVWEEGGELLGYAYAGDWKTRSAYRHTPESSVYVAMERTGRGVGKGLYQALLEELGRRPVHSVVGVLALPNPASVALHETLGFVKVGHLPQVGRKFGRWIDVGYWQLMLE